MAKPFVYKTADFAMRTFAPLCLSEELSDVTLIAENTRIPAHRVILAASSDYYRKMFFGSCKEANQSEIQLPDISAMALKLLMPYFYTGMLTVDCNIDGSSLLKVLQLAHYYALEELVNDISHFLADKITFDNVVNVLTTAFAYDHMELTEKCFRFLDDNAAELLNRPVVYKNMTADMLAMLLKPDSFVANEEDIFHMVEDWRKHNPTQNLSLVLEQVRFSLMTTKFVVEAVNPSNLLDAGELFERLQIQFDEGPKPRVKPETPVRRVLY